MPKWIDADHAGDDSALLTNTPAVESKLFQNGNGSAVQAGEMVTVVKADQPKQQSCDMGWEEVKNFEKSKNIEEPEIVEKEENVEVIKDAENVGEISGDKGTLADVKTCCVCGSTENVKRCSKCKCTHYCSTGCQKSHREHHAVYCQMIVDLKKVQLDKVYGDQTVRQSTEDVKTKQKLIQLVGEKPTLQCRLGGKDVSCLWDSGSQVCIVSQRWAKRHFPNAKLHPVSDFYHKDLQLLAANKTKIGYTGVMVLSFALDEDDEGFDIPVLVSKQEMTDPILGSNVMKEVILNGSECQRTKLRKLLECEEAEFETLAAIFADKEESSDFLTEVKSSRDVHIPAGHKVKVKCRVKTVCDKDDQTVYFAPVISGDENDLIFTETVSK